MSTIKDQFNKASEAKKNDVKTFIWKFPKKRVNGETIQEEVRLMDVSEEQLNQFYKHCHTMLYNKDPKNIGRYELLNLIKEQQNKCNAMLYINWLATGGPDRKPYPRHDFFRDMKQDLDNKEATLPRNTWSTAKITNIQDVPAEFASLTIQLVYDACLDTLGVFNRQHLTNNFIIKMGLWFTADEIKDLNEYDENGKLRDRRDVIIERCNLRKEVQLTYNQNGGLTYNEFRAMRNLKSTRYSELTTKQLTLLRDKILARLEEDVKLHIRQWTERIRQIEKVAEVKGFTLNEIENK